MKVTGATWNAYLSSWPDGQWFDDSDETFDGVTPETANARPDAVVQFTCGIVLDEDGNEIMGLVQHFNRWMKAQTIDSVLCEIPKQHANELKKFLKEHGGRIVL